MSTCKKMLLIINPIAGKMRARAFDFPKLFPEFNVTVFYTQDAFGTQSYVTEHAAAYDMVVCAGGDGTLNNVINGLMHVPSRPTLGYIPCGTTNDFATSLGIPKDIPSAVKAILDGSPVSIDVGSFQDRYFSYVASFGAFTESSYKAPQETKNRFGHFAYIFEAMRDLPHIRPCHMVVKTKEKEFEGDFVFGAVSNSTSLGGMVRLSPKQISFNDGFFEVMLIHMPQGVLDLQQIIFSLIRRQYNPELITFFKTSEIQFKTEQVAPWSLDGEYAPGSTTVTIRNHPKAITLQL